MLKVCYTYLVKTFVTNVSAHTRVKSYLGLRKARSEPESAVPKLTLYYFIQEGLVILFYHTFSRLILTQLLLVRTAVRVIYNQFPS